MRKKLPKLLKQQPRGRPLIKFTEIKPKLVCLVAEIDGQTSFGLAINIRKTKNQIRYKHYEKIIHHRDSWYVGAVILVQNHCPGYLDSR